MERNKDISINQKFDLPETVLWSPENPSLLILTQSLYLSDSLIDKKQKPIALFDLKSDEESIKLNGSEYFLKGVTHYPGSEIYGRLISYDQMERDIALIKEAGFNCVRFTKSTIHPYYLSLCEKYGLFAFLEIPINGVPSGIAEDESFISRSREFLFNYISFYGEYSLVCSNWFWRHLSSGS